MRLPSIPKLPVDRRPMTIAIFKDQQGNTEQIQRHGPVEIVLDHPEGCRRKYHVTVETEGVMLRLLHEGHEESHWLAKFDEVLPFNTEIEHREHARIVVPHSLGRRFETWVMDGGQDELNWYRDGEIIWEARCAFGGDMLGRARLIRVAGGLRTALDLYSSASPVGAFERVGNLHARKFLGRYEELHNGALYTVDIVQNEAPPDAEAKLAEMRAIKAQATHESEQRGEGLDGLMLDRGYYQMIEDLL